MDTRLDDTILEQAKNLKQDLEMLEKIDRCGVAWESRRAVRTTLYALGDLIRFVESSDQVREFSREDGENKVSPFCRDDESAPFCRDE